MSIATNEPDVVDSYRVTGSENALRATAGSVVGVLRSEGAVALAVSTLAYHATGGSWALFGALFLLPDVSMLGYLANRRVGAATYNVCHTYLAPAVLGLLGWTQGLPVLNSLALIWVAHIGLDRLMGYGLKYGTSFKATHLSLSGNREADANAR